MSSIAILQPSYLPWLGFFDQVRAVDSFVYYDSVPFDKNGWRNRNKIKTASGFEWLTVPVRKNDSLQVLRDTKIALEHNWSRKHLETLGQAYAKAPYRDFYLPSIKEIILAGHDSLVDLIYDLNNKIFEWLEIETRVLRSSDLELEGDRNQRLVGICTQLSATNYFSGDSAENYLDTKVFASNSIQVKWQKYVHPTYRQLHGPFISHLSIIDLLFNEGPASKDVY